MTQNLTKAQDIFLDRVNSICNKFGLNNIMAQLYAILYLSGKPMSLDDMVEQLKISKGSASINIRALERYGAVKRVFVKGSRKDYYEAESDIAKVVIERIRSMVQGRLSEVDDMINSSDNALDSISPQNEEEAEAIKVFKDRLDKLRDLYTKASSLYSLSLVDLGPLGSTLNNNGLKAKNPIGS
jgi:DNA-binding transcriptional regulator GbsR (MarR family)